MDTYQQILVVLDGVSGSNAAIGHAVSLARVHNARVDLLFGAPRLNGVATSIGGEVWFWREGDEDGLPNVLEKIPRDIGMNYQVAGGDLTEAVRSLVERKQFELIILSKFQAKVINRLLGRRWLTASPRIDVPILLA